MKECTDGEVFLLQMTEPCF